MPSPTKTKVLYSLKNRRESQSSISVDRTGAEIQDVPPELSHLSDDELATPFPHILFGGYIKYYQMQYDNIDFNDLHQRSQSSSSYSSRNHEKRFSLGDLQRDVKKIRRSSSASLILGPLLSHTPNPSPSREIPSKSYLFSSKRHSYQPSHLSHSSSSSFSSFSLPRLTTSPFSRLKHSLTVIHEASRETMSVDHRNVNVNVNLKFPQQPKSDENENESANENQNINMINVNINAPKTLPRKKPRITSYPSSTITQPNSQSNSNSLTASASALSLSFTPPPRSTSLQKSNSLRSTDSTSTSHSLSPSNSILPSPSPSPSPAGSLGLRRRKRQLLRTPSVEKDFAKCAKDLMGLHNVDNDRSSDDGDGTDAVDAVTGDGRINKRERTLSTSSGSELGEDGTGWGLVTMSRTVSESTTATSIMEESENNVLPLLMAESQKHDSNEQKINDQETLQTSPSPSRQMASHNTNTKPDLEEQRMEDFEELSEVESMESTTLSTPPTSIGCGSYKDKRLSLNGNRDSWVSYTTAKSSLEEVSLSAPIENGLEVGDRQNVSTEIVVTT